MADPSAVQAAQLALGDIREAWPYLDVARDAAQARARRRRLPMTGRAAAELDELLRAERRDRAPNRERGLVPLANTIAPADLAVVDAETRARAALVDLLFLASSRLRERGPQFARYRALAEVDAPIDAVFDYLAVALPLASEHDDDRCDGERGMAYCGCGYAQHAASRLAAAAAGLRKAVGLADAWQPVRARCPACLRMSLRGHFGSPDARAWTIECAGSEPDCLCRGVDCPCQRPGRRPDTRHLWAATQLRHLGRIAPAA